MDLIKIEKITLTTNSILGRTFPHTHTQRLEGSSRRHVIIQRRSESRDINWERVSCMTARSCRPLTSKVSWERYLHLSWKVPRTHMKLKRQLRLDETDFIQRTETVKVVFLCVVFSFPSHWVFPSVALYLWHPSQARVFLLHYQRRRRHLNTQYPNKKDTHLPLSESYILPLATNLIYPQPTFLPVSAI